MRARTYNKTLQDSEYLQVELEWQILGEKIPNNCHNDEEK